MIYFSSYIIQIEQPLCILKALQSVSMLSMYRQNPRILFLPTLYNPVISTSLMSTQEIKQMPDVLVVDLKAGVPGIYISITNIIVHIYCLY